MNPQEGVSLDELRKIGERKAGFDLPLSASDINLQIPYVAAQQAIARMEGFTDDQLKALGEHRAEGLPSIQPMNINGLPVQSNAEFEQVLDDLNRKLNIRTV